MNNSLTIVHFFLRIFDEFFSGFRAKFQKIVTCAAFSIKFAKTNQKFAENSEFCEKNSLLLVNYSLHSLIAHHVRRTLRGASRVFAHGHQRPAGSRRHVRRPAVHSSCKLQSGTGSIQARPTAGTDSMELDPKLFFRLKMRRCKSNYVDPNVKTIWVMNLKQFTI